VGPPYAPCHSQPGTSVGCRALEWNLSEGRAEKREEESSAREQCGQREGIHRLAGEGGGVSWAEAKGMG